jgi:hypothetical protein
MLKSRIVASKLEGVGDIGRGQVHGWSAMRDNHASHSGARCTVG